MSVTLDYICQTLVPLEKLLSSGEDSTRLLEEQLTFVTTQSQASKKKIEHLTELLNDSEATVARLTDQAVVCDWPLYPRVIVGWC